MITKIKYLAKTHYWNSDIFFSHKWIDIMTAVVQ